MPIQRQLNLEEIKDWLLRLDKEFEANKSLKHLDANIDIELFFRDLLNLIYDWSLKGANWSEQSNQSQDTFDLCDPLEQIAVQVTSTMTAQKIKNTLSQFLEKHQNNYRKLIFIYPRLSKPSSNKDYADEAKGFDFNPKRDRWDLRDLLFAIQSLNIDKQQAALALLRKELKPLGKALQLGADANVEAIIRIIQHISSGIPDKKPETRPDADKKLKRFAEYANYLNRQYTSYIECYKTIAEARSAVGYDTVLARRCGAWLKERSLTMLEETHDDAKAAFDALVEYFKEQLHSSGSDCDDGAMRYFLADEFQRCNVFPNPEDQ